MKKFFPFFSFGGGCLVIGLALFSDQLIAQGVSVELCVLCIMLGISSMHVPMLFERTSSATTQEPSTH